MRIWPDYILDSISALCEPIIGRRLERGELSLHLDRLRREKTEGTLTQLAADLGFSRQALRARIRKAGLPHVRLGGPTGREEVFRLADVLAILEAPAEEAQKMNRVRNPYDIIVIDGKRYQAVPSGQGYRDCAFHNRERDLKGLNPCSLAFKGGHRDVSCVLAACNVIFEEID